MEKMLNPNAFAAFLMERAEKKDGYIMCAVGQDPKTLNEWYYEQYEGNAKQLTKALYWKEHAERVWDCQGMADGYVAEMLGVPLKQVNVRARNNYAEWCGIKGTGKIPAERRVPGAAVFIHNGDYISHVGFLVRPVDEADPAGDWYVVEARGVMYGVVTTKLHSRGWNRWGLMTKYFDYSGGAQEEGEEAAKEPETGEYGERNLRKGMVGADVQALQRDLIALGYSCGKYGADGDFGSATKAAVKAFQRDTGLTEDGIAGPKTFAMIAARMPDDGEAREPAEGKKTVIVGRGTWNIRTSPSLMAPIRGYASQGASFAAGMGQAEDWVSIIYQGEEAWISEKGVRD